MGVILVVNHLPAHFSSADLRKIIEPHAPLIKCWVVHHQPGGWPLQFGYVEVPTVGDAKALMKGLSGIVLDGKPVSLTILETA